MKTLSVGAGSVPWKSIEVKRARRAGAPAVLLHARGARSWPPARGVDDAAPSR